MCRADDIFVFVNFYRNTLRLAPYFAVDTRLTQAFSASATACLATSTTSAFAFAANIFSPVPAIQSFGLVLALLVIVNYVLAITWLPVCLALWDRYIMLPSIRRALRAGPDGPPVCGCLPRGWLFCCLEADSAESRTSKLRASYTAALHAPEPAMPRVLEYDRIAWLFTAPPPLHRLARPPGNRRRVIVPALPQPAAPEAYTLWWRLRHEFFRCSFDAVWRIRWLAIAGMFALAIAGAILTSQLKPPPTSEPPLFDRDNNVQVCCWRCEVVCSRHFGWMALLCVWLRLLG